MTGDGLESTIAKLVLLGYRLDTIMPADDPRVALLSGNGARLRVELEGEPPAVVDGEWKVGRASMEYRDLIPSRLGGRLIASHIRIPTGGPVPDYVHFHEVDFQLIHVKRGWVRLVYEDQGPPFVLHEGETVLQPPKIRHRVLESAPDGLEVIELGSPASHPTHSEHSISLPTKNVRPDRDWDGQRFIGTKEDGRGFFEASGGRVSLRVLGHSEAPIHDGDVYFGFVRRGEVTVNGKRLQQDDSFVLERGAGPFELRDGTPDLSLLEIRARL